MTFLAPAAGIVGAAIALPALLALYFLRLRRRPLRVSSTLLWEQAARDLQVNVPLRMIRWSALLLLHLAALTCLLIAVARPAIGSGGAAGSRVVIIIDCSGSMGATDMPPHSPSSAAATGGSPRTRLAAAKDRAFDLIESIGRAGAGGARPRCMVMSMASAPQALTGFTTDLRELRDAVESVAQTDQPDDLGAALRLIDAMTSDAAREDEAGSAAPAVYLVTDGVLDPPTAQQRRGIWPMMLLVPRRAEGGAPAPAIDNIGIVATSARYDPDDQGLIRVFARLVNSGPAEVSVTVRCTVDGEIPPGGVTSLTLPAATLEPGTAASGEAAAVFAIRPPPSNQPRPLVVSISRPDVLACDDAAGVIIGPPWRPRILVVAPDPSAPASAPEPDLFLLQALEATEPASLRVIPGSAIRAVKPAPGAPTPLSPFAGADIVVFDRVEPGAGEAPALPSLSFGAGLPSLGVRIENEAAAASTAIALAWRREHPALQFVGLDTLLVAPAASIELPADASAGVGNHVFTSIVDGSTGPLVAEVSEKATSGNTLRRLVVAFDLSRSNWGPDVSFPLFISNAIGYLGGSAIGSSSDGIGHTTTQPIRVTVPEGTRAVTASGGVVFKYELRGATDRIVSIGPIPRAGLYRLRTDNGRPADPETVIVNMLSERETRLVPQLQAGDLPGGVASGPGVTDGGPREIWHWFVLAAILPLTVEWFVYAWRMRG